MGHVTRKYGSSAVKRELLKVKCGSVAWVGDTLRAKYRLQLTFGTHLWLSGSSGQPKYRSVKTAVATHVALVVPPPLVPARAERPLRSTKGPPMRQGAAAGALEAPGDVAAGGG